MRLKNRSRGSWLIAGLAAGLVLPGGIANAAIPDSAGVKSAQDFRDSISVNTRTAYGGHFSDCSRIKSALAYIGIRHIRDSLHPSWRTVQRQCYRELYDLGIRLSGGPGGIDDDQNNVCDSQQNPSWDWVKANVASWRTDPKLRGFVDMVEGENEPDYYHPGVGDWPGCIRAHQQLLYELSNGEWPVIGPSFGNSGGTPVGDIKWTDYCNLHPYPGGEHPEYRALDFNKPTCDRVSPGKPIIATETGYHTDLSAQGHPGVSRRVQATYTLRLLAEFFRRGVKRTDLWTLVDGDPSCTAWTFGVYDCNWQPKQAAHALHNLTTLVGSGSPDVLRPVDYTVTVPDNSQVERVLLRRGDETYVLIVWRAVSIWNRDTKQNINVSPVTVTLTLPAAKWVNIARPVDSATETRLQMSNQRVSFPLAGEPVVLRGKLR
jgi:hypothetical protein